MIKNNNNNSSMIEKKKGTYDDPQQSRKIFFFFYRLDFYYYYYYFTLSRGIVVSHAFRPRTIKKKNPYIYIGTECNIRTSTYTPSRKRKKKIPTAKENVKITRRN